MNTEKNEKKGKKDTLSVLFLFLSVLIIGLNIFLRFYQMEERLQFTWDQIENAWMMKDILLAGKRPLLGMQAKASSGFSIGPMYYYLLAPFYAATDLHPIAGGYFAGMVSLATVLFLLFGTNKMFGKRTALFAAAIYTVSYYILTFDRIPWPVNLIPIVAFGIYYSLWNIISGKPNYYLLLGFFSGFAFHVHVTAIFFPLIIVPIVLLSRPKRNDIPFIIGGLFIGILFFIPMVVSTLQEKNGMVFRMGQYYQTTYQGIHLRRVLQLIPDTLGDIGYILFFPIFSNVKYFLVPVFCLFLFRDKTNNKQLLRLIMTLLFFLVPAVVLATFRGELSNYYYSITRPVSVLMIAYCLAVVTRYSKIIGAASLLFLAWYSYANIQKFIVTVDPAFPKVEKEAKKAVEEQKKVDFVMGDPKSYLYFYYLYKKSGKWQ